MSNNTTNKVVLGDRAWQNVEKINSELFVLTYGAVVAQMVRDGEDSEEVNKVLEQMGYNIGVRLIDDFMARSGSGRCHNFDESAEVIAKVGFKMFLGVAATVVPSSWNAERTSFSLQLEENVLAHFVELPDEHRKIKYSNILCGVLRGALEMVQLRVECDLVKDAACGDDTTEVRVTLKEVLQDEIPVGDD